MFYCDTLKGVWSAHAYFSQENYILTEVIRCLGIGENIAVNIMPSNIEKQVKYITEKIEKQW